jgi:signal transduction histidine kinase
MEGSPVRGPQKDPIVQLNESHDLQSFQAELVRLTGPEFEPAQLFFGMVDTESQSLQLPAWIKSHLERYPGLHQKLEQGEMVGIGASDESPVPRPAAAARSSVLLIPVIAEGVLCAAMGLVSPLDGPQLSAEEVEVARQRASDAAPILTRLQQIEKLRQENQALSARKGQEERIEKDFAAVIEERNSLDAILQMRSHHEVNAAHELRTPLAAIRGYVRMMLDGRGGEINEKQKEYLHIVADNTNRLITLVNWMSEVTELSAQQLKPTPFDFREIWNECVAAGSRGREQKALQLNQEIGEGPIPLVGDREKLTYVLSELLKAAAKFAPTGATINAELSHGREREVNFKVSVAGAEIPADVLIKIFERPFNTVTSPMAQNQESGEINLSGVYDIVGMHGGRFFVNSNAGRGVAFLFTLPAVTTGSEEKKHEQAVNSGRRRR